GTSALDVDKVRVRGFLPPTLHDVFGILSYQEDRNTCLPFPLSRGDLVAFPTPAGSHIPRSIRIGDPLLVPFKVRSHFGVWSIDNHLGSSFSVRSPRGLVRTCQLGSNILFARLNLGIVADRPQQ